MKGLLAGLALALVLSCGAGGDGVLEGTTAQCAYGGQLIDCPPAERTPEGACWRLVDCDAIDVKRDDGGFDWGVCVDEIEDEATDVERLIIDCIAVSTCDELRVGGHCFQPEKL